MMCERMDNKSGRLALHGKGIKMTLRSFLNKQHPTSSSMDPRNILGKKCDAFGTDALIGYPRKCPVTTCPDHDDRSLWPKTEKNKHIMTFFEGNITFSTNNGLYSLRWPSFVKNPATYFHNIKILKHTIKNYNQGDLHDVQCWICCRNFNRSMPMSSSETDDGKIGR